MIPDGRVASGRGVLGLLPYPTSCRRAPARQEQLARVLACLNANIHDPTIRPRDVAVTAQISVRQLHRLFGLLGMSMGAWVRRERLRRCARALRDPLLSDCTITEIAFAWGFNDSAHFSRCFKEFYGVTPSNYRAGLVQETSGGTPGTTRSYHVAPDRYR